MPMFATGQVYSFLMMRFGSVVLRSGEKTADLKMELPNARAGLKQLEISRSTAKPAWFGFGLYLIYF